MKPNLVVYSVAAFLLVVSLPAFAADHPGSGAKCGKCHAQAEGDPEVPKVMLEQPGFFARLFGEKTLQWHPSVSCVGAVKGDGSVTGCHDPDAGRKDLLVIDLAGKPSDELCGRCHAGEREPGGHHPSYKADKDGDGIPEAMVRPVEGQEIYTTYAPHAKNEPLHSHPDAMVFVTGPDGAQSLDVVLPLETTTEEADGQKVEEPSVVTCTTCHNPHFGYLAEVGSEEELNQELVAREQGDGLLRLRDYDNSLCDGCHWGSRIKDQSWKLKAESWKLKAESWKLKAEQNEASLGLPVHNKGMIWDYFQNLGANW
jgi:hypothetical protein